jgi:4-hydroxy-tetrahydrodipicolinate reductase
MSTAHAPLTRVALVGASGRMGQALMRAAPHFPQLLITGAIASPDSLALGRDAGQLAGLPVANLPISSDLPAALATADVAIDFSSGEALGATVEVCRSARKPLLIGTTGYGEDLAATLQAAAADIPLLVAANTSIGVALLIELVRHAAATLPSSFDIDVLDLHHRTKPDAPSGTALALGSAAAAARHLPAADAVADLSGPGPRPEGRIGYAAVRAGDLVGEHTVLFSGVGEQLSLSHRALDRAIFARGALSASLWLTTQPPGRYGMRDFLGFKTVA